MQTKASASPSGVKIIHPPTTKITGIAATLNVHTISTLVRLACEAGTAGVNIWTEHDEEVEQTIYHLDVGGHTFQSSDLICCILRAGGEVPMRVCGGRCGQEKPIDCFPLCRGSKFERGYYCNLCNRLTGRKAIT